MLKSDLSAKSRRLFSRIPSKLQISHKAYANSLDFGNPEIVASPPGYIIVIAWFSFNLADSSLYAL